MKTAPEVDYSSIARENLKQLREDFDTGPIEKVSVKVVT